ncbi:MAG: hypothetical protein HYW37_01125 [Candidatus Colwellbacteria bacterium]|nr:hypothetical protein [Candidatus Colwellbacteria bacterium]
MKSGINKISFIKLGLPIAAALYFLAPGAALAVNCSPSAGGALTISSSCTFPNTVDGVDNGDLTVALSQTLTINAGQTVAWNSGQTITVTGSIAINSTGQLKQTNLWMVDTDGDGYADSLTQYAQDTAPTSGRRRNVMTSTTSADAAATDSTKWQYLTGYADADNDTYTTGASQQVLSGATLPAGYRAAVNGADCNDTNNTLWQNLTGYTDADGDTYTIGSAQSVCSGASLPSGYRASATATDCNDANGAIWRNRYRDADGDGYGVSSATCVGNDAGYVDNSTDCNDGNASVWQNLTGYTDADNDGVRANSTAQSICSGASLPSGYTANANGPDCNDANATVWQNLTGYLDADGDAYTTGPYTVCSGASLPSPYLSTAGSGADCYDSNANAKPGQTAYYSSNRGDGSFDYNCSGVNELDPNGPPCDAAPNGPCYARDAYSVCGQTSPSCSLGTVRTTATNAECGSTRSVCNPSGYTDPGCSITRWYVLSTMTWICH